MRHLADMGLIELSWRTHHVRTTRTMSTARHIWDPDHGTYREVVAGTPEVVERAIEKRAVRLTPLGAYLVERARRELEQGKRIRWSSLDDRK
jgi:hypothetical protein